MSIVIERTNWTARQPGQQVVRKSVVLYPNQVAIIAAVAKYERRSFSNALQYIVERYYDANVEDFNDYVAAEALV